MNRPYELVDGPSEKEACYRVLIQQTSRPEPNVNPFQSSIRASIRQLLFTVIGVGLTTATAIAEPSVPSYEDVLAALQSGKTVKVLTDLAQCKSAETGKGGPAVQGGLQINAYIVLPEKGIFFSDVHQTLDTSGQPVTEYIRYVLGMDGKLSLTVSRQTTTGMVKQDPLACQLAAGARFVW